MSEYKVTVEQTEDYINSLKYEVSDVAPNVIANASDQDKGENEAEIELHLNNYSNLVIVNCKYANIQSLNSLNNMPSTLKYYDLSTCDLYNKTFPTTLTSHSSLLELRLNTCGVIGTVPSLLPFSNLEVFVAASNNWGNWISNKSDWNRVLSDRHNDTNHTGINEVASDFAVSYTLKTFSLAWCALSSTSVDRILAAFDNAGASNGTLNIIGGFAMGVPSSTGLNHKTNLESRGWSVTVKT